MGPTSQAAPRSWISKRFLLFAAVTSRDAGASDVAEELEEIGLSQAAGWHTAAAFYTTGSLMTVGYYFARPGVLSTGVLLLGILAGLLALFSFYGGRRLRNADWATHFRISMGCGILTTGALIAGPPKIAYTMIMLLVILGPTYLYGIRFAVPYATFTITMHFVAMVSVDTPAGFAHALIGSAALWMIAIAFMVAEQRSRGLARLNRKLAYTDPLTGSANTRKLRELLDEALDDARRDPAARFALFALDLDDFKLVNDEFDHATGDAVLKAVAEALEAECGAGDLVARRGGDEFSVLVRDAHGTDLECLRERLTNAVARARHEVCPSISPSGSVAYVVHHPGDDATALLKRADDALHKAKLAYHAGDLDPRRNRRGAVVYDLSASVAPIDESTAVSMMVGGGADSASLLDSGRRRLIARLAGIGTGLDPLWAFAAFSFVSIGLILGAMAVPGLLRPLSPAIGGLAALVYLGLGWASVKASHRDMHTHWLHPLMIVAMTTLGVVTWQTGAAGAATAHLFAVLQIYGFFFFRARLAILYFVAGLVAYTALTLGFDYPYAELRVGVTDLCLLVTSGITVRMRAVTVRFVRANRALSETDALTGLANIRALRSRIANVIGRRTGLPPALVAIDLDHFKDVNDVVNHTRGDQVIEAVARTINDTVRAGDLVARRGGDEFFVLVEDIDDEHLELLMERISRAIVATRERLCPGMVATASIGWARWGSGEETEMFMRKADLALHDAKVRSRGGDLVDAEARFLDAGRQ